MTYDPVEDDPRGRFITGNRLTQPSDFRIMEREAALLVRDPSVSVIYFGGAEGVDTTMLQLCRAFRDHAKMEFPYLIGVCPCTVNELRDIPRQVMQACADVIVELENRITVDDNWLSFHVRNEWMVNHASSGVKFWNGDKKSGTHSCAVYAQKMRKSVKEVRILGSDRRATPRRK